MYKLSKNQKYIALGSIVAIIAYKEIFPKKKNGKKKLQYKEDNPIYQEGFEEGQVIGEEIGYAMAIRHAAAKLKRENNK